MMRNYPFTVLLAIGTDDHERYSYTYVSIPLALPEVTIARIRSRTSAALKAQANSYLMAALAR